MARRDTDKVFALKMIASLAKEIGAPNIWEFPMARRTEALVEALGREEAEAELRCSLGVA